jgi:hypothetical protein
MPEYQPKGSNKQDKKVVTHHDMRQGLVPIAQNSLSQDLTSYVGNEIPSHRTIQKHGDLLSRASSGVRAIITRQLQQNYGNHYVQRLLESPAVQPKLTVNTPDNQCEQEADTSVIQRQTVNPSETATPETKAPETKSPDPAKLSSKAWWDANENKDPLNKKSSDVADLASPFKENVEAFKKALEDSGASISIDTTLRPKERAHVLHYAWQVAKSAIKASDVPAMDGVDIIWDHGDDEKSKAGANEIITAANVASKPSLTSRHIEGKAIDWTIEWTTSELKIKNKDGVEVIIKSTPHNGGDPGNTELHAVGKGYGVIKGLNFNPKDPPHWSSDGH